MIRAIAAIFVGLATAMAILTLVGKVGHSVYPMPEGLDRTDAQAMAEYVKTLPTGALLFTGAGWWLGALLGGLGACSMAKENALFFSVVIAGGIVYLASKSLRAFDYPGWFDGASIGGILVALFLAVLIARRLGFDQPSQAPIGKGMGSAQ
ncbi:MAG: hypothetical protein KDB61_00465 [Planctomycetes bacterium]|nr:hypothetical protein [Planctomycetota bacterium]